MCAPDPDHYAVLGVAISASPSEIRSAFLRLIRESHPDAPRNRSGGPADGEPASEAAARIIAAYRCLHDPYARIHYDRERRRQRQPLVLVDHGAGLARSRSWPAVAGRILIGLLLIACASGAIYVLSRDRGVIGQVFAADRSPATPADRMREQLRMEAGLDVEWVMTMHGPGMLGPLSRQCFSAQPEQRSRAQCAYCIAFDDAAAHAVPGDAYFGDRARAARQASCPA